jgi:hypothetical protein
MVPTPIKLAMIAQEVRDCVPTLASHLVAGIIGSTAIVSFSKEVSDNDVDAIQSRVKGLDEQLREGVKVLFGVHTSVTDKSDLSFMESLVEALEPLVDENIQPQDTPAGLILMCGDEEVADRVRSSLEGMKSKKYHRILIIDMEAKGIRHVLEVLPSKSKKLQKGVGKPSAKATSSLKELEDPARQRTKSITKDDILNLKILLGQATTIEDFIASMDRMGA